MNTNNGSVRKTIETTLWSAALAAGLAAAVSSPALAGDGNAASGNRQNPGILPPQSSPHGHTYAEWAGAWWRWTYSFPAGETTNPVQDPTGALAHLGDQGSVWFLAGSFNQTLERTATIPPGKTLFVPIINGLWINLPDWGDAPWSDEQQDYAIGFLAPFVDNAFNLSCEIDGVPVANLTDYRTQTAENAEYLITIPENGLGLPAGTYGPSVDDGIYLMLAPLSPGTHTIHFTSASKDSWAGDFALDVTYHLTVLLEK
jgi:hypothetical protein